MHSLEAKLMFQEVGMHILRKVYNRYQGCTKD